MTRVDRFLAAKYGRLLSIRDGLYRMEEKLYDMLSRFHPIPGRYGRTDGRMDGRTDRIAISISRVSVLTHDKNR